MLLAPFYRMKEMLVSARIISYLAHSLLQGLSNSGVDREMRGWKNASDQAPVWIKLEDKYATYQMITVRRT